jgi:L-alanine-DL-glutamate epimerase-like enolase superfamily enzyme
MDWFAPLYQEKIDLIDGLAGVPDAPGWAMALDRAAIRCYSL